MTAINWLASQLAWEQRLVELRSQTRPDKERFRSQRAEARAEARAARQAA